MNRLGAILLIASICFVFAGCGLPSEIPVGSWAGQGVCMNYRGSVDDNQPKPNEQANTRSYETTLKISGARAFGRDALRFQIHSKSGKLHHELGDEVKIDGMLIPLRTLDSGAVLYAVVESQSVKPDQAEADLPPATLAQATSTQTDRGVVLQMHYTKPSSLNNVVVDTFHFSSAGVLKTGSYVGYRDSDGRKRSVRIWWIEELHPVR